MTISIPVADVRFGPEEQAAVTRVLESGWDEVFGKFDPIPNAKTDTNNHGSFSTDNIGFNYDYPEASYARRAEILAEAGLPDGVFNVVTGPGPTVGQAMAEHMDLDMLSFTGSTAVGRAVVAAAGQSNFKKLGLELGGKNPQIVFADADLEDAAEGVSPFSGRIDRRHHLLFGGAIRASGWTGRR